MPAEDTTKMQKLRQLSACFLHLCNDMKQKKLRITVDDYLLAQRKASREEEIRAHGKQIRGRHMLHKSKKTYSRKNLKPVTSED